MKKRVNNYDDILTDEDKSNIINDYVNNLYSIQKLIEKYNVRSKEYIGKLLGNNIRSISEANRIAHKLYPDSFKHSEETRKIMSEKRKQFIKEHPEKTAWRLKNMSYPEKCFQKILENNGIDKKCLIYREFSVYPYFIDFAFINEKIAIEIDGSQHLEKDRMEKDRNKDELLETKGWTVIRISASEVINNEEKVLNTIKDALNGKIQNGVTKVGILVSPKTYEKVKRGEDGLSDRQRQNAINQRKIERPNREMLKTLIFNHTFVEVGKMYNVSDNTIRKWCKSYSLPCRRSDIDELNSITRNI